MAGVSHDGAVIAGSLSYPGTGLPHAFRWTESSGVLELPALGGYDGSRSVAVSADGSAIVGTALRGGGTYGEHFRWTETGGTVALGFGTSQRQRGWPAAVSRDGSVVVGSLANFDTAEWKVPVPFRWTESGGVVVLDPPPGAGGAEATHVSADGAVVVGHAFTDNLANTRVFRWTEATGSVDLDSPADAITTALFVSADGSVIVGVAGARGGAVAFRWSERTGFVGIGPLPGFSYSRPTGISADGSVVVGVSATELVPTPTSSKRAFRWTEKSGLTALEFVPRDAARHVNDAIAVSSDGSLAVGLDEAWNPEGGAGFSDVVVWTGQGCPTQVRLEGMNPAEGSHSPQGVSGDGRTIIGTARTAYHNDAGWVARLP